jgi:hypothetical protein
MNYFTLEPEVPGGLERQADRRPSSPSTPCERVEFVTWLGDDLLETFPHFFVSARLASALDRAALSGYSLSPVMTVVPSGAYPGAAEAPGAKFRQLLVSGIPRTNDFGIAADGRLVVSGEALQIIRRYQLSHCDIEPASAGS